MSAANADCAALFCRRGEESDDGGACSPACQCGSFYFAEPDYVDADIHALLSWRLIDPPQPLETDPYDQPASSTPPSGFCAAIPVDPTPRARTYRLETFATEADARTAGGQVTHAGPCGACSSFADLAVYIRERDLTDAGQRCGLRGTMGSGPQLDCLRGLGFTEACTRIWSYNVDHTRDACLGVCAANVPSSSNMANGDLNACLTCDEEQSGPVFKALAGRTRRRSGLASAIARPCLDSGGRPAVYPVEHYYFELRRAPSRQQDGDGG